MSYPTVSYTYHADDGVHYRSFNNNFEDIATVGLSQKIKDIKVNDVTTNSTDLTGQDVAMSNAVNVKARSTFDDVTARVLGLGTPLYLTVTSNAIVPTRSFCKMATAGGITELHTITDTTFDVGSILILTAYSGNHINVKHASDNIFLSGGIDKDVSYRDMLVLIKYIASGSARWLQVGYSNNG